MLLETPKLLVYLPDSAMVEFISIADLYANTTDMENQSYILLTGAAGFIGSVMAGYLNQLGHSNLVLVDDFGREDKRNNWESKRYAHIVERYNLEDWLIAHQPKVDFVIHLGARTEITELNYDVYEELNVAYSQMLWNYCTANEVPLIYASSAVTYGTGESGYNDDHELSFVAKPLNPYGVSKNEFDKWALEQAGDVRQDTLDEDGWVRDDGAHTPGEGETEGFAPPFWAGLKIFNVYGPNEYHKGKMASMAWQVFRQIRKEGVVRLFKSHRPEFTDGQQMRDFVYVKDVVQVIGWMMEQTFTGSLSSGLYNLGTGKARSFYDLAAATFRAMDLEPNIIFIDMPPELRDKYQYFTEANMEKLRSAGYQYPFTSLEEGVEDYVRNYLQKGNYY